MRARLTGRTPRLPRAMVISSIAGLAPRGLEDSAEYTGPRPRISGGKAAPARVRPARRYMPAPPTRRPAEAEPPGPAALTRPPNVDARRTQDRPQEAAHGRRSVAFQSMWRTGSPGWYSLSCLKSVPAPRCGALLIPISARRWPSSPWPPTSTSAGRKSRSSTTSSRGTGSPRPAAGTSARASRSRSRAGSRPGPGTTTRASTTGRRRSSRPASRCSPAAAARTTAPRRPRRRWRRRRPPKRRARRGEPSSLLLGHRRLRRGSGRRDDDEEGTSLEEAFAAA